MLTHPDRSDITQKFMSSNLITQFSQMLRKMTHPQVNITQDIKNVVNDDNVRAHMPYIPNIGEDGLVDNIGEDDIRRLNISFLNELRRIQDAGHGRVQDIFNVVVKYMNSIGRMSTDNESDVYDFVHSSEISSEMSHDDQEFIRQRVVSPVLNMDANADINLTMRQLST